MILAALKSLWSASMNRLMYLLIFSLAAVGSLGHAEDTPEARLKAAGYSLPDPTRPVAAYVTWRRSGNQLYLSGHGECGSGFTRGKVGKDLTMEQGKQSAQRVGLCMLATIKSAVGDLSQVKQFLRIDGMVNTTDDFTQQPEVVNGFSELMVVAFGDAGLGARAAVGMASLPRNIPVEISAIVELHD
jgi:enamine deaminase RidA (YjgF/YER057c/UK114 family)